MIYYYLVASPSTSSLTTSSASSTSVHLLRSSTKLSINSFSVPCIIIHGGPRQDVGPHGAPVLLSTRSPATSSRQLRDTLLPNSMLPFHDGSGYRREKSTVIRKAVECTSSWMQIPLGFVVCERSELATLTIPVKSDPPS